MRRPADQEPMGETDDIGAAIRAAAATVSAPAGLRERLVAQRDAARGAAAASAGCSPAPARWRPP
ncbi:MAG: hypothetical protein R2736_01430 [Solirubrobacterales bacterium]